MTVVNDSSGNNPTGIDPHPSVSATLAATADATPWLKVRSGHPRREHVGMNLSISGAMSGTITLERTRDGGTTILAVKTYTAAAEEVIEEPQSGMSYRIKYTSRTSGSPVAVLSL